MKHIRLVTTTVALTCALATSGAWAAQNDAARDRAISREVANDLIKDVAIGPYGIRVRSRDGVVYLSGSVGTVRDWKVAAQEARGTAGVTAVQNDLSVLIR